MSDKSYISITNIIPNAENEKQLYQFDRLPGGYHNGFYKSIMMKKSKSTG